MKVVVFKCPEHVIRALDEYRRACTGDGIPPRSEVIRDALREYVTTRARRSPPSPPEAA